MSSTIIILFIILLVIVLSNTASAVRSISAWLTSLQDSLYSDESLRDRTLAHRDLAPQKTARGGASQTEGLYPIMNYKLNLREASKEMLLLEQHLNISKKRCYDCIRKHFLLTEGLLDEAISLSRGDQKAVGVINGALTEWVALERVFVKAYRGVKAGHTNADVAMLDVAKKIREIRKPLMNDYYDIVLEYI